MFTSLILFCIGVLLLVKGADYFVGGGAGLAARFGVSTTVIGFTVIAFGTSLPEFVVNMNAAIIDTPGIALGNVLGSNIANIALVLALCALLRPDILSGGDVRGIVSQTRLMLAATALFLLLSLRGTIDLPAGIVMLVAFILILRHLWKKGAEQRSKTMVSHGRLDIIRMAVGAAGVVAGSYLVVQSAVAIAEALAIPAFVIGMTMVAIGTSLPELATSLVAVLRNQAGISAGNILGSNIFNILFVMGCGALIRSIPVISMNDVIVTALFSAGVVPLFLPHRNLTRAWGGLLLVAYCIYILHLSGAAGF